MDAGDRYHLYKDIEDLQFKVKTLREDNYELQKRIKKLEEKE
tara:strand:- start:278 stop:403 length:126 start_codon:yes stop_codon:yes gene_type:complete